MISSHVVKKLSAYCHGELAAAEQARVGAHLAKCARCRKEYDEIRLAVKLAEHLPQVSAPESLWSEIENLLPQPTVPSGASVRAPRGFANLRWPVYALSAAALFIIAIGAALYVYLNREAWTVEYLSGETVTETSRLGVGDEVKTDQALRARIQVGAVGEVVIDPNSQVRLLDVSAKEHRLALDRGRLQAQISAPPRLFIVDTPSAAAIDLGCAYTLEVDDRGRSFLHVTSGRVALEKDGREVTVFHQAMCQTRPNIGPGTPFFTTASQPLRDALERFDFEEGGDAALATVIAAATVRDTYTLWSLLPRVNEAQRARVYDRIVELFGQPRDAVREEVLRLDEKHLFLLRWELHDVWWRDPEPAVK